MKLFSVQFVSKIHKIRQFSLKKSCFNLSRNFLHLSREIFWGIFMREIDRKTLENASQTVEYQIVFSSVTEDYRNDWNFLWKTSLGCVFKVFWYTQSIFRMKILLIGDFWKKFSPKNAKVRFFLAHPVTFLVYSSSVTLVQNRSP